MKADKFLESNTKAEEARIKREAAAYARGFEAGVEEAVKQMQANVNDAYEAGMRAALPAPKQEDACS